MADTIRINWAVEQLKKKHDKPFFLACGIYAPHFPNYCPQKYFDLYDLAEIELPPTKDDDLDDLPPFVPRRRNKPPLLAENWVGRCRRNRWTEQVKLMTADNQQISQWMDRQF